MELTGRSILGYGRGAESALRGAGVNPATGERLPPEYSSADAAEVTRAAELAQAAFSAYHRLAPARRAEFLRAIAAGLEEFGDAWLARAELETALPRARLSGERTRTCAQLRLLAAWIEEGSWVEARIDHGDPQRQPQPKPDVRSMLRPLGPVAVFCAANFPFAFSVAGGDTAAALAAGCPVVAMAHSAHPGTAEMAGTAILQAARRLQMPEGVFSLLFGVGYETGQRLVEAPAVAAVAFTGSRRGGMALARLAAARPRPIPIYAEMSSVNPVFLLERAVAERAEALAAGLAAAVTLGVGQFCTNPGIVALPAGKAGDRLATLLAERLRAAPPGLMLNPEIHAAYWQAIAGRAADAGLRVLAAPSGAPASGQGCTAGAALFEVEAESLRRRPELQQEIFGPATLLARTQGRGDMLALARALEGNLTASVHGTEEELASAAELLTALEDRAGRLVVNGYPTGVEVNHAMVHGGPWPATTDARSTSVGTRSLARFARPVCFQDWPDALLPEELQEANPRRIWRLMDGSWSHP